MQVSNMMKKHDFPDAIVIRPEDLQQKTPMASTGEDFNQAEKKPQHMTGESSSYLNVTYENSTISHDRLQR